MADNSKMFLAKETLDGMVETTSWQTLDRIMRWVVFNPLSIAGTTIGAVVAAYIIFKLVRWCRETGNTGRYLAQHREDPYTFREEANESTSRSSFAGFEYKRLGYPCSSSSGSSFEGSYFQCSGR